MPQHGAAAPKVMKNEIHARFWDPARGDVLIYINVAPERNGQQSFQGKGSIEMILTRTGIRVARVHSGAVTIFVYPSPPG